MQCTTCSKVIPAEFRFCAYCGAAGERGALAAVPLGGPSALPVVAAGIGAALIIGAGSYAYLKSHSTAAVASTSTSLSLSAFSSTSAPASSSANATTPSAIALAPTDTPPAAAPTATATAGLHGSLLFVFSSGAGPGIMRMRLPDGQPTTVLPASANADYPEWLRSGPDFIYVDEGAARIDLLSKGVSKSLVSGRNADVSPDGTKLAYVDPAESRLMLANADGSGAKALTPTENNAYIGPTFSPDGAHIAYAHRVNGVWQLFVINPDGSGARQVTHGSVQVRYPVWSPDGTQLAFNSGQPANPETPLDLWVVDVADGKARKVLSGGANGRPFWAADGYLFFNSTRANPSGGSDIFAVRPDGSGLIQVTKHNQTDVSYYNPVWSPGQ